jgi:cytochrome b561
MRADSSARYGSLQVPLHWLMLALLVAVYACIELRELYPRGSEIRLALKTWHFMLGLSVLILVGVRLVVRAFGLVPPISPRPPPWQLRVAHGAELPCTPSTPLQPSGPAMNSPPIHAGSKHLWTSRTPR